MTALPFLRDHGKIQPGHHVLTNGASGAVGSSAVQLARSFGANVTGVCGPANAALVRSLGADTVIDYTQEDFTRTAPTYDLILDTVGNGSFARSKAVLKPGGVYVTTVLTLASYPHMLWTARIGNKRAIIAYSNFRPASEKASDLHILRSLVEAGMLRPVIDRCFPLAQAAERTGASKRGARRATWSSRWSTRTDAQHSGAVGGEERADGAIKALGCWMANTSAEVSAAIAGQTADHAPGNLRETLSPGWNILRTGAY